MLRLPPLRHMFSLFPNDFKLHFPTQGSVSGSWKSPALCQGPLKILPCLHMAPKIYGLFVLALGKSPTHYSIWSWL